jgi:hypothetical protein
MAVFEGVFRKEFREEFRRARFRVWFWKGLGRARFGCLPEATVYSPPSAEPR